MPRFSCRRPTACFSSSWKLATTPIPSLGTAYTRSNDYVSDTFGVVPEAFVKLAPTDNFSIQAGKLPTLIGAESNFTFQNMNIERGLLFNQTPTVSRGVQANYSSGPISVSLSVNDGYYSAATTGFQVWRPGRSIVPILWQSMGAAISAHPVFQLCNSGGTEQTRRLQPDLHLQRRALDRAALSSIFPCAGDAAFGFAHGAEMFGAGLLGTYTITPSFSLSGRVEYGSTNGNAASPNLLYGPTSKAWSVTLTPTWQYKLFFVRGEVSYVGLSDTTPGLALGSGSATSQVRGLIETGSISDAIYMGFLCRRVGAPSKSYAVLTTFTLDWNKTMLDIALLITGVAFFAICEVYARLCEAL